DLVLVGAIFVVLTVCAEPDAPAASDHLAAHLVVCGGAESHVREVGVLHRLLLNVARIDFEPLRQILASLLDRVVFADGHTIQTTAWLSLFPTTVPVVCRLALLSF